jgi:hypothetical protein
MDQQNVIELDSLFSEKNLLAIYKKAPSFFSNFFNTLVVGVTGAALSLFAISHILCHELRATITVPFADTFTMWANAGAVLAGTILGFLIAGFAILCTVLRPQTMLALQRLENKQYGLSELKLLFVIFVDVLVQFLALLVVSVLVLVVGGKAGPASMLGMELAKLHWMIPFVLLHVIFVLWGTWFVALVLTLKSFVYNLYQTLLLSLADTVDDYQRQKLSIRCERSSETPIR